MDQNQAPNPRPLITGSGGLPLWEKIVYNIIKLIELFIKEVFNIIKSAISLLFKGPS